MSIFDSILQQAAQGNFSFFILIMNTLALIIGIWTLRLLGTSKQVLSRYENGLREPKINTVTRYAERLGVDVLDLLNGQGTPPSVTSLQTRVIVIGGGKEKTYSINGKVADLICDLLDRLER